MTDFSSILIVGERGMLAHAFREVLAGRGMAVTGGDLPQLDITDASHVAAWFDRVRPTLVINCAAYTNVDGCEKPDSPAVAVNGLAVGTLAREARRLGATLVHFSTDYVFDGTLRRPLKPDDPVAPQSAYGRSKLLGEQELQRADPPGWLLIRTAWLYGPNGSNFPQAMLSAAKAGKPLRVVDDQIGSPTYTLDLAQATLDLLQQGASGIWHVSNAGQTSWFGFAKAIFQEFGIAPVSLEPITSEQWKQIKPDSAIRPSYSVFDLSPLERLLARPMPSWQDALRRYRAALGKG